MKYFIKALRKIYRKIKNIIYSKIVLNRNDNYYDNKFLSLLGKKYPKNSSESLKYILFNNLINSESASSFIYFKNKSSIPELINEIGFSQKSKIISDADNVCSHKFDLLGSGNTHVSYLPRKDNFENPEYEYDVSPEEYALIKYKIKKKISEVIDFNEYEYDPIDWQVDFISGYRWNNKTWYRDIKYGQIPGSDIKIPWELSRANHFLTLGQAYYLTKDEKYAIEFICQSVDWIESNPCEFGVNWACTMDVAIRACNWIVGLSFFMDSSIISEDFIFEFTKSLYFHGCHIKNNLENELFAVRGNHYLSDITGLLYLGVFFKEFEFGKKWFDFAIGKLKKEINLQVYNDGCDFESSTYYHRLVLELFFFSTLFAIKSSLYFKNDNWLETGNKIFSSNYMNKLQKMFYFILYAIKPNGCLPQIGDNDNGRLHIFNNENIKDVSYLLSLGAIFFKDKDLKIKEFEFSVETYWIFGENARSIWDSLKSKSVDDLKSKSFENAGWFILRDKRNHMFVSAGSNGQNGLGGHAHNDKLSFSLSCEGENIFVDSGTYAYTSYPKLRNKFRSVYSHNTVVVDSEEQNRFKNNNLFYLKNDAKININKWETNEDYDVLNAEHRGYIRLATPVTHRRQIVFDKVNDLWLIKDNILGGGPHNVEVLFHLAPNIDHSAGFKNLRIEIHTENGKKLFLKLLANDDLKVKLHIEDGFISESYGQKTSNKNIIYSVYENLPLEFVFIISKNENQTEAILKNSINLLN
ncbi:MAG: alginate lyase family protein [Candidatus Humimicrobiaceae bacterium]